MSPSHASPQPRVDVSLTVEGLPLDIAEQVKRLERDTPELVREMVVYAVTRRLVFDALRAEFAR